MRLLFKSRIKLVQNRIQTRSWSVTFSQMMAATQQLLTCAAIAVVFTAATSAARGDETIGKSSNTPPPCNARVTCHECIQTRRCSWCSDPEFGDGDRCFMAGEGSSTQCRPEFHYDPKNSIKGIKNSVTSGAKKQVHITPQRIAIRIRVGEPQVVSFEYTQPPGENYPVDLYHVMDLTYSMADDKDTLQQLGDLLMDEMSKITDNSRFGFGSFVDKKVLPFVSVAPARLLNPCTAGVCLPTYGFRNHKSLDDGNKSFSDEVQNAKVSSNLDGLEGGFDAIMQAVVCQKEIGWRKEARKILIFLTDAGFHIAGDGRLAGIVTPNDGMCHLDPNGEYTHSTLQDYPSIGQLNVKVRDNAVNVIFAVTDDQLPTYKLLEDAIEGSRTVDLSRDSSNIVELLRNQYKKITSTVQIKDNARDYLRVTYSTTCTDDRRRTTGRCEGIEVNQTVRFDATVTLLRCPEKSVNPVNLKVSPVGVGDKLIIEVTMLCGCPCEDATTRKTMSEAKNCSSNGTYQCGICVCDATHFGLYCECEKDSEYTHSTNLEAQCSADNTTLSCNGRGTCNCGICQCDVQPDPKEVISGKYCECDNFSCKDSCSDHGTCDCGQCICDPDWSEADCGCRASNNTCVPPSSKDGVAVCHGRGDCSCGACACHKDKYGRPYGGEHCQELPSIANLCALYKDFVDCSLHQTAEEPSNCTRNSSFAFDRVDSVQANETNNEHLCEHMDVDQCRFSYVYRYNDVDEMLVQAKRDLQCPQPVIFSGFTGVMMAVIVVVVVIVALLFWKVITHYRDKREYAKFERQKLVSQWGKLENPLFLTPISKFNNPMYEKQD